MALRAGYTNATVHFIDADDILLTFSTRKLMLRSPEQREGDDDHTVRAEVVHLPDGKVLRETEWRMHDRSPYLWPMGNGRFLLRERSDLYSLDPMGSFTPEHLGRRMLLHSVEDLDSIQVSPGHDLLLLETTPARRIGDDPEEKRERPVTASFYRVTLEGDGALKLTSRGHASSHDPFSMAFTSTGVLQTVREDRMHWGFDFRTFGGKNIELAGFTSTCRPRSIFISDAEFFAYGCRGGEDRRLMGGFNLLADAKWVFTLDDAPLWLSVETAPEVGRFAVRNTVTGVAAQEADQLEHGEIRMQEVRVYSDRDGEELIRVDCTPTQRPGGNFALSPDGLRLAILRGGQLEIYLLPPVSPEDRKLHAREQAALVPLKPAADTDVALSLSSKSEKSDGSH